MGSPPATGLSEPSSTALRLRAWGWTILTLAVAALALKLLISWRTYGTNDVKYWWRFLQGYNKFGGVGLYHQDYLFNHPPFLIHVLRGLGWLDEHTRIPFPFWLRLPAIVSDLVAVFLVARIARLERLKIGPAALAILAASPVSVMVSGFHGNTDPLMITLVLASIYLIDRGRPAWLAGAVMGAAMSIKIVPVIFLLAVVFYLRGIRPKMLYCTGAAIVFILSSMPYLARDPLFISGRLLGYGSIYGHWGWSRVATWMLGESHSANAWLESYARFAMLGLIVAGSWWMNRRRERPGLFIQCGTVAFFFMTVTPGFGVQYLAWLVPWVVAVGWGAAVLFNLTSGAFLFFVYTYWCQGLPWYFADSDTVRGWKGWIVGFELLAWGAVGAVLVLYLRSLRSLTKMSLKRIRS